MPFDGSTHPRPAVQAWNGDTSRGLLIDTRQEEGRAVMRGILDGLAGPRPLEKARTRLANTLRAYRSVQGNPKGYARYGVTLAEVRGNVRRAIAGVRKEREADRKAAEWVARPAIAGGM